MLKKYTSNKIFSLTDSNDINEIQQTVAQTQKIIKQLHSKNIEEKNDSQPKNSILIKDILKSNSITQNNKENILNNNKSKISPKNGYAFPKNNKTKNNKEPKTKIKTTFSNYYTDYIFKNGMNINKSNFNNFTEIACKENENEDNEITDDEKTLKANRLKYLGLYNTDSSQKINFNNVINTNNKKDFSPNNKVTKIISPNKYKRNNEDKKNAKLDNPSLKLEKIKKGRISENSNNLIYINNINESNNLSNNNISRSNKNLKKYKELFKNNKNQIKKKKTNNLNQNKKQNLKKINDKNKERNKLNKIKEYENQFQNKTSNKNNIINGRKHIFLSPLIKTNNNLENNKSSSKRQKKPNNYKNNLNKFKAINSTSNKEIKKIFFKFRENQSKTKIKKVNGFSKENLNYKLGIKKNSIEKSKFKNDYQKIITLKKDKENSSTIKSEDKNTEKDFNLENNKISEKSTTTKSKNFKDYFKMARKVLKNTSHSLVESITNGNNIYEEIDFKNKISEAGQITNRNQNTESDDDSNNYTIKKVPVFSGINMFPPQKFENNKLFKNSDITGNLLYKIFVNNNNITKNNNNSKNNNSKNNSNNISKYIISFLDIKSKLILSSLNKDFFKNLRSVFYKAIFNKVYKNRDINLLKKLNNSLIKSVFPQYKSDIYEKASTQTTYIDIILSDIARTFPKDSKFQKNGKNYKKLYNILTKYSNYNKDIGYAQGLNFMFANALLLYENEKDAFFYIDGMIKKFKLKKFFAEKNSKLIEEIRNFSRILEKYNPEIVNFFEKKYIYHEFFSTDWILTLFSNSMEPKNLFICWNFMIFFGWKFFYCLVIQILRFYKRVIFHTNENGLNHLMKNLLKGKKFTEDLPNILNNTFIFMQKHIIL